MTTEATNQVYYDPWDADLNADPYPMFKRLRDDAPLYYNEPHDFYAVSRFDDVNRALVDNQTFSSAKGVVLEILKSGMEIPPGTLVFEDPPIHDIHRNLLSRAFYATQDQCPRTKGPRIHRAMPRPPRGRGSVRLCQGSRRHHAAARGRHAVRHPGALSATPPRGRRPARPHRTWWTDGASRRRDHRWGGVRRVHRLAGGAPRRRPHHRASSKPSSKTKPARCGDCIAKNSCCS